MELLEMLKKMGLAWDLHDVEALMHEMNASMNREDHKLTLNEFLIWWNELDPKSPRDALLHDKIVALICTSAIQRNIKPARRPLIRLVAGWTVFMAPAVLGNCFGPAWGPISVVMYIVTLAVVHYQFRFVIWWINTLQGSVTLDPKSWENLFKGGGGVKAFTRKQLEMFESLRRKAQPMSKKHLPLTRLVFGNLLFGSIAAGAYVDMRIVTFLCFTFGCLHFLFPHMIR